MTTSAKSLGRMKRDTGSGNIFLKVRVRTHFLASGGTNPTDIIHDSFHGPAGSGSLESAGFMTPPAPPKVEGAWEGRDPKDVFIRFLYKVLRGQSAFTVHTLGIYTCQVQGLCIEARGTSLG